ncbi:hypothetical protein [Paraliobacillus salinarum]|nr:hypothetical protein [Paraliobacillus salinarum]
MVTATVIVLITLSIVASAANVAIIFKARKIANYQKSDRGDF